MEIGIGVDAHKAELAVAAVDRLGRRVAQGTFANEPAGHVALVQWVTALRGPRRVGIEGAGSYAWQAAGALQRAGEEVVEVPGRLTRRERRHQRGLGKSDPLDALAIARVVLGEERLKPVSCPGPAHDLKLLMRYRDALIAERTRLANQLHADLQALRPGYGATLATLAGGAGRATTKRLLAPCTGVHAEVARWRLARLQTLDRERGQLERRLVRELAPLGRALPAVVGIGPIVAARVRGEVGDIRRFASAAAFAMACGVAPIPASSGQTSRYRLNRGGNRRLNAALHTVALVQARVDPRAKSYLARKRSEGKSWREAMRCLKRHLADVIYRALLADVHGGVVLTI